MVQTSGSLARKRSRGRERMREGEKTIGCGRVERRKRVILSLLNTSSASLFEKRSQDFALCIVSFEICNLDVFPSKDIIQHLHCNQAT